MTDPVARGASRSSRSSSFSSAFDSVSELFPVGIVSRSLWRQPQEHDDPDDIDKGGLVKTHVQHRHEVKAKFYFAYCCR